MKVKGKLNYFKLLFGLLLILWQLIWFVPSAVGEKEDKRLPERDISVFTEYTAVVVPGNDDISVDLTVANRGRRNEDINLEVISIPKGWEAWIKAYNFDVTGVHVESDESKNLTFRVEPGPDVSPGKYTFRIQAQTEDKKLTSTCHLMVTITGNEGEKKSDAVSILTSYPVLRGPTDAKFEFSIEVENKSGGDAVFSLSARGPEGWDIDFKPAYEDKFISSLRLKGNQSQTVAVEVEPYPLATPGQYNILVKVSSPEAKGETSLMVELTGKYQLEVGTINGLLSLNAVRGKSANLSVYVQNSGSATLTEVQFLSSKLENWQVEFKPERIDSLAPNEIKQVEVYITPFSQALVGDYSIVLSTDAGKVSKTVELRVTVNASTAWGWIGISVIVLVIVGLVFLFIRFGRR